MWRAGTSARTLLPWEPLLPKQKRRYLLCDETVESKNEQQSSADGSYDEAKLVQVSDWSSLRSLHRIPTITVCRREQEICDCNSSTHLHNSLQVFLED